MTEQVEAEAQAPDTQNVAANAEAQGSETTAEANPFASLGDDVQELLTKRGINSLDTLAANFAKQSKFVDSTVRYPGADDPEKLQAFYEKVRPESADAYEVPEGVEGVDPDLLSGFNNILHDAGVSSDQYAKIAGGLSGLLPEIGGKATEQEIGRRADEAYEAITTKFGGKDSAEFNEAMHSVSSLIDQEPEIKEMMTDWGLLDGKDGAVIDARAFDFIHRLSKTAGIVAEGKVEARAPSDGDVGIDLATGQITNPTKAGELFKADPERYRSLTNKSA